MNEYLLSQIYVEMNKYETRYDKTRRQYRAYYIYQYHKEHRPSFWDKTLFNTGSLLVFLGERLKRNRGCLRLSEDCQ